MKAKKVSKKPGKKAPKKFQDTPKNPWRNIVVELYDALLNTAQETAQTAPQLSTAYVVVAIGIRKLIEKHGVVL